MSSQPDASPRSDLASEPDERRLHDDAVRVLRAYAASGVGKDQQSLAEAYLGFLAARSDAMWRSCEPGHLTASALVLSADRSATLLTLHPRVGQWLQLGGHCEPGDPTLLAAALREATEESGIVGLEIDPLPVRLDVHALTCSHGKPTRHLDVQYRAYAPTDAVARITAESDDLAWHPVDALPGSADRSVRLLVEASLNT